LHLQIKKDRTTVIKEIENMKCRFYSPKKQIFSVKNAEFMLRPGN